MKVFFGSVYKSAQIDLLVKGISSLGYDITVRKKKKVKDTKAFVKKKLRKHDIFHFHFGESVTGSSDEYRYARKKNKVRLMHYWGEEIRERNLANQHNPYAQLFDNFEDENVIKTRLQASKYMSACIVPHFEMVPYTAKYFDRIYVLPYAAKLSAEPSIHPKVTDEPLIVYHANSKNGNEVDYIEYTLKKIRQSGYRFRTAKIKHESSTTELTYYDKADLVIDQIMQGSYTPNALYAMLKGITVISYIREDLKDRMPQAIPVISANPANLYDKICAWLKDNNLKKVYAAAGPNFVKSYHSLSVVAKQLRWIYNHEHKLLRGHRKSLRLPAVHLLMGTTKKSYLIDPKTRHIYRDVYQTGKIDNF